MKYDIESKAKFVSQFTLSRDNQDRILLNRYEPNLYVHKLRNTIEALVSEYDSLIQITSPDAEILIRSAGEIITNTESNSIDNITTIEEEDIEYAYGVWKEALNRLRRDLLNINKIYARKSMIVTLYNENELKQIYELLTAAQYIQAGYQTSFIRIMQGDSYLSSPKWKNVPVLKDFFEILEDLGKRKKTPSAKNIDWSPIVKVFPETLSTQVTHNSISSSNSASAGRTLDLRKILTLKKR